MRIRSLTLGLIFLVGPACNSETTTPSSNPAPAPVAALGIQGVIPLGDGPHQGLVQEVRGTQVEVVVLDKGEIRAYVSDEAGTPITVEGSVSAEISAPEFAGAEITMTASADGAFYVGKLPGPPPTTPAQVAITFPEQSVTVIYPQVALVVEAVPLVELDIEPPRFDKAGNFLPPHGGTVQPISNGENFVEVVVAPSGDVQVYAYEQDGVEIPASEFALEEVQVVIDDQPRLISLRPDPSGFYFVGRLEGAKVQAKARVDISFPKPVVIRERPVVVEALPRVEVRPAVVFYRHDRGKHKGHYKAKGPAGYKAGQPSPAGYGGAVPSAGYEGGVKVDIGYKGGAPSGDWDKGGKDGYKGATPGGYEGGVKVDVGYKGATPGGGWDKDGKDGYKGAVPGYGAGKGSNEGGYKGAAPSGGWDKGAAPGYDAGKGSKGAVPGYGAGKGSNEEYKGGAKGTPAKANVKSTPAKESVKSTPAKEGAKGSTSKDGKSDAKEGMKIKVLPKK